MADQPEGSASAILATVVAELNKHKIGVPRSTAAKNNELLAEPELQVNRCYVCFTEALILKYMLIIDIVLFWLNKADKINDLLNKSARSGSTTDWQMISTNCSLSQSYG